MPKRHLDERKGPSVGRKSSDGLKSIERTDIPLGETRLAPFRVSLPGSS